MTHLGGLSNPLTHCLRLQTVTLWIEVNPIDSWQGIVTALHEAFAHLSSAAIRTLDVMLWLGYSKGSPIASSHSDQEFWDIDMESIHSTLSQTLFDSLQKVSLTLRRMSRYASRLTSDAVVTAAGMDRRVRSILQPWDKREILSIECVEDGSGWDWERDPMNDITVQDHDADASGVDDDSNPSTCVTKA